MPRTCVPPMPTTAVSMAALAVRLRGQRGAVDGLGRGPKLRDQALAHALGRLHAVPAIAQHAVLHLGHQHAALLAAGVQHGDQVFGLWDSSWARLRVFRGISPLACDIERSLQMSAEACVASRETPCARLRPWAWPAAVFAAASVERPSPRFGRRCVGFASPGTAAPGCISSTTCRS